MQLSGNIHCCSTHTRYGMLGKAQTCVSKVVVVVVAQEGGRAADSQLTQLPAEKRSVERHGRQIEVSWGIATVGTHILLRAQVQAGRGP